MGHVFKRTSFSTDDVRLLNEMARGGWRMHYYIGDAERIVDGSIFATLWIRADERKDRDTSTLTKEQKLALRHDRWNEELRADDIKA